MSPGLSTRLLATQSDERLVALVRDGHERAFEALVLRYRRPLLNYCRRLALPEARVEDVLQQALLKTWIALRGGAEVRDIKAWLYRVVHNTAINAVRDAARERERLSDPALRIGACSGDLERGLVMREALAEVAALPELQREVIVRTVVGGDSHEQVASELGISDGAVRGLLYRARATLRTAATALTPPPLLGWMAGRVQQSPAAPPEVLTGLAAGGGAAGLGGLGGSLGGGLGGLLVKGGVVAVTAGTLITGAVVHLQSGEHRAATPQLAATASGASVAKTPVAPKVGESAGAPTYRRSKSRGGRSRRAERRVPDGASVGKAGAPSALALRRDRPAVLAPSSDGATGNGAPAARKISTVAPPGGAAPSPQPAAPSSGASGGQAGGTSGGADDPVGFAAGSGSGGAAGSEGTQGDTPASSGSSSNSSGQGGTEQSGSADPEGSSGSGAGSESESSGAPGSAGSGSGDSGSGQSEGGLVGAVVHEVGNLLEHVLH